MKHQFDDSWKDWIRLNIKRGCDKDGMVKILLDNDFHPLIIIKEMNYRPISAELQNIIKHKNSTQLFGSAYTEQCAQLVPEYFQPNHKTITNDIDFDSNEAIDDIHLPFAQLIKNEKVHMYTVDAFLTDDECNQAIKQIQKINDNEHHTNTIYDLENNAFVKNLDRQISDYMGIEPERSDKIKGVLINLKRKIESHTDILEYHCESSKQHSNTIGKCTWSFMIYLNDVPKGGQTDFTELGISITPKKGKALIWNKLLKNGKPNPNAKPSIQSVLEGKAYIVTKTFRTHGSLTSNFIPFHDNQIPLYTQQGFKKTTLPIKLFKKIDDFYQANRVDCVDEKTEAIGFFIHSKENKSPSKMVELSTELKTEVSNTLHPMLEKWCTQKLEKLGIFGIREYQSGATLDMHIDRYQTHLMGVIINIDQNVKTDWPLYIYDHFSRLHKVILKPGDVLFYESAKLAHGRPDALNGKRFANVFAHTKPVSWKKEPEHLTKRLEAGALLQKFKYTLHRD